MLLGMYLKPKVGDTAKSYCGPGQRRRRRRARVAMLPAAARVRAREAAAAKSSPLPSEYANILKPQVGAGGPLQASGTPRASCRRSSATKRPIIPIVVAPPSSALAATGNAITYTATATDATRPSHTVGHPQCDAAD